MQSPSPEFGSSGKSFLPENPKIPSAQWTDVTAHAPELPLYTKGNSERERGTVKALPGISGVQFFQDGFCGVPLSCDREHAVPCRSVSVHLSALEGGWSGVYKARNHITSL